MVLMISCRECEKRYPGSLAICPRCRTTTPNPVIEEPAKSTAATSTLSQVAQPPLVDGPQFLRDLGMPLSLLRPPVHVDIQEFPEGSVSSLGGDVRVSLRPDAILTPGARTVAPPPMRSKRYAAPGRRHGDRANIRHRSLAWVVGRALYNQRRTAGLTQDQLARCAACNRTQVARIEAGAVLPGLELLLDLCVGLNVAPAVILPFLTEVPKR